MEEEDRWILVYKFSVKTKGSAFAGAQGFAHSERPHH